MVQLVAGITGALLLGLPVKESIGGIGGSIEQLGRQALSVVVALVYSFVVSYGIAYGLDLLIGIRVEEEDERRGLDLTLHDEQSYVLAE